MKANPLSYLAIIQAFSRESFSSKATIIEQNGSTIFRTTFSYEASIILFGAINTDLTCKHIWKTY